MIKPTIIIAVMAAMVSLTACAPAKIFGAPPPAPTPEKETKKKQAVRLEPRAFAVLQGWNNDDQRGALSAFLISCGRIKKMVPKKLIAGSANIPGGTAADWAPACMAAEKINGTNRAEVKQFFEIWFTPYLVTDQGGDGASGLFTGYFEPELKGSLKQGGAYQTPLYTRPPDLISVSLGAFDDDLSGTTIWGRVENGRLKPYAGRKAIENGTSGIMLKPLAWALDPVEAFFLHVQGSGRIRLEDGSVMRLGFAGKNGLKYRSIGRLLIDRGEIPADRLTMDSIAQWVRANPEKGRALIQENPSFIFFRSLTGPGPIGAGGYALTPGRSLAVDRRYLPLGVPLWLETAHPLDKSRAFNRLMVAQDSGGAIKGVVRGDIFFGAGADARAMAGNMKRAGRYFILLPTSLLVVP